LTSQDNTRIAGPAKSVKDRLLDAAEGLFCEHGFKGTSIRDIAAMRDARIESINKVMSQAEGRPNLEDLLRSFADTFVGSMVDTNKSSRLGKLMAREYIDSHLPSDMFVNDVMTPTINAMHIALVKTCPDLDESKIMPVVFSVIGQLVHLVHVKTMFKHGGDDLNLPIFDSNEIIEHIVKFSAAGIRAYTGK